MNYGGSKVPAFYAPAVVTLKRRRNGDILLSSPQELAPCPDNLVEVLRRWADAAPLRVFLAERKADGTWRELSYAGTVAAIDSISQSLLDLGLRGNAGESSSMIAILSENGIDHALLYLAAMQLGIIVTQISPAYSLASSDHAKLKFVCAKIDPALIFVADGLQYAAALRDLHPGDRQVVVGKNPTLGGNARLFSDLLGARPGLSVAEERGKVGPDTIAKVLFTSGSTDFPKGVTNTHRMLVSNMQGFAQLWPFLREKPPVLLDWLPWNHTFGSNHNFNLALYNGGTLYIDDGKASVEGIERTVRNLREISPTIYFNVPRGYQLLMPYLEKDTVLRDGMLRRLDMFFYAGASLPHCLWERLEALSVRATGRKTPIASGWGMTETSPGLLLVHYETSHEGNVGLPLPGVTIKLTPSGGKLEMRAKGPNVMKFYWKEKEKTREAFDEEGFLKTGDAGRFEDPGDPAKGMVFDGRIGENFKLMSGTWVQVGNVAMSLIDECAPLVQDAVLAGQDKEALAVLVFLDLEGCRSVCESLGAHPTLADAARNPQLRRALEGKLRAYNEKNQAGLNKISRAMVMREGPSLDASEVTAKGNVRQNAVLANRADLVQRMYSATPGDPEVIFLE